LSVDDLVKSGLRRLRRPYPGKEVFIYFLYMKMLPSLYPSPLMEEGGVGVIFMLRCARPRAWQLEVKE
jgi:hypothetical protein